MEGAKFIVMSERKRVDQNEGERAIVSSILSQLEAERSESMDARVQVSSFSTIDDMIQYIRAINVVHDLFVILDDDVDVGCCHSVT